jgi:hypothetical protein
MLQPFRLWCFLLASVLLAVVPVATACIVHNMGGMFCSRRRSSLSVFDNSDDEDDAEDHEVRSPTLPDVGGWGPYSVHEYEFDPNEEQDQPDSPVGVPAPMCPVHGILMMQWRATLILGLAGQGLALAITKSWPPALTPLALVSHFRGFSDGALAWQW